ncbi:4a-hydroxytetrahydrobiopterin dehydratase [Chitinilyticum litopenaei]|uniref:4a-hydroxytetrahydrobiopterin dehydratase n=1 Tax=Chitinilyticum litopenaei TaxID=1121276 RepID=UPI0003F8AF5A|nr:4a-hydroxytetrahydrobiopterin dehydratase [Chitinilyticum litopenaei]
MLLLLEHCSPNPERLTSPAAEALSEQVADWQLGGDCLERRFEFADFHDTMAFVNAVAWIAHSEAHHPELAVSFGECRVRWSTFSAGGLTRNDFICAAKINALFLA